MYGLNLPDKILKKIYYQNAARIVGLKKEGFEK
jgi:predicted TIM-barrel fold metal-dependent hydrolase